jgi:hypothetical protein
MERGPAGRDRFIGQMLATQPSPALHPLAEPVPLFWRDDRAPLPANFREISPCDFFPLGYIETVMAASKPIPIRFESHFIDRLDAAADKVGSNRAAIIRFCVLTFVEYLEGAQKAASAGEKKALISDLGVLTGFARRNSGRPFGCAKRRAARG